LVKQRDNFTFYPCLSGFVNIRLVQPKTYPSQLHTLSGQSSTTNNAINSKVWGIAPLQLCYLPLIESGHDGWNAIRKILHLLKVKVMILLCFSNQETKCEILIVVFDWRIFRFL
jgi:hypothetical protein